MKNGRKTISMLTLSALLVLGSTQVAASAQDDSQNSESKQTAYADSVYDWGLWEFGPSPAAGGAVHKPSTPSVKPRNVQFRPNDTAAFSSGVAPVAGSHTNPTPITPPISNDINAGGSGSITPGSVPNPPNGR